MKKHVATFRFRGKKYGIRRGGNLHAIGVLAGLFTLALVGYATICLWATL